MIELKNVSYSYTSRKRAQQMVLEDISYSFKKGTFYTIFGPSGAGKTTCLYLLGGIEKPTSGQILLDEKVMNVSAGGQSRFRGTAYIFQDFRLFPYMTGAENVATAIQIKETEMKWKEALCIATNILRQLGLTPQEINRSVSCLSGGQQQRVAIARAIAVDASYILADEPTGNLDYKNAIDIIELLKKLAHEDKKCVITVTHSDLLRDASDKCILLENGRILRTFTLQELKE